jgi:hypothetical protein
MYGMQLYACKDSTSRLVTLAINASGISVFAKIQRSRLHVFLWRTIRSIKFNKRNFLITVKTSTDQDDIVYTFEFELSSVCKVLHG